MGTVTNITTYTIYEHFSEYSDAIWVPPSSSYQKFGNFWEGGNKHTFQCKDETKIIYYID